MFCLPPHGTAKRGSIGAGKLQVGIQNAQKHFLISISTRRTCFVSPFGVTLPLEARHREGPQTGSKPSETNRPTSGPASNAARSSRQTAPDPCLASGRARDTSTTLIIMRKRGLWRLEAGCWRWDFSRGKRRLELCCPIVRNGIRRISVVSLIISWVIG